MILDAVLKKSRMQIDKVMPHSTRIVSKIRKYAYSFLRFTLILGLAYVILFPMLFLMLSSIRTIEEMYDPLIQLIPRNYTFIWFTVAFKRLVFIKYFKTTFSIALMASLFQMVSCALIGYGFARFRFFGKNLIYILVLFTFIVPPAIIATPSYLAYAKFDILGIISFVRQTFFNAEVGTLELTGTIVPILLPTLFGQGIKAGLFILIFRQFFAALPKELDESARIDGCGYANTFFKIMLPNVMPAIITVVVLSFVWHYNDTLYPKMYRITTLNGMWETITYGDVSLETDSILMAGGFMILTPLIVIYALSQRLLVNSFIDAGIKG